VRLAVTGGRSYDKRDVVWRVMNRALSKYGRALIVVDGMCGVDAEELRFDLRKGLDGLVFDWCVDTETPVIPMPAHWNKAGPGAGPARNARMCDLADMVLAFPGGTGTANCASHFSLAGKPVVCVDRNGELRYFPGA
jgi:hypothetical protein